MGLSVNNVGQARRVSVMIVGLTIPSRIDPCNFIGRLLNER